MGFGTTNTRMAVIEGESAKVIVNSPSVVAYVREGDYFVGEEARLWAVDDPKNTICGIQHLLGRKFDDPIIRKEMEIVPYRIVRAPNGYAGVEAHGRQYSPTEIAAKLLANLKKIAEKYLFKSVSNAIITFPRDVTDAQYNTILDAASMAGLDLLIAINENFDVSLLGISNGDFQCVGKHDPFLGGKDFDDVIVEYLVTEIKRVEGIDISMDKLALQRLRLLAEDTKIALSSYLEAEINWKIPWKKVNPDEAVVVGAASAIQAGFFPGNVWDNLPNNVALPRGEMEFSFRNGNRIANSTSIVKFPFRE
ncbi:hypothetical protein IFM89_010684 [Coptis chinensis]|uniref:Heat shock protein 70 n=1 Tax=Coptis chinensis TaxID=261450 RepID=A0A835H9W7_9MAGN|nr:hypothetical protein IFM89_010684 [Coptis chinensis]